MANTYIKATKVVDAGLAALARDVVLPSLVWRDAVAGFEGAANDTVSIRVPSYRNARTRTLRGGTPLVMDDGTETKVDVVLNTDVYSGTNVSDEEMTLDIRDFGVQVLASLESAVARGIEDEVADAISGATYALTLNFSKTKPLDSVLAARKALNKCNVPMDSRALAVGADIEEIILKALANRESGADSSENALQDATVGRYGGFRIVSVPALAPDEAYAFHKSAFPLVSRAPIVPDGASWGTIGTFEGFAMRVIKDYDPLYTRDRCIANCYIGCGVTLDDGDLNEDNQFIPEDGSGSGSPILVRAVKLAIPSGS